MGSTQLEDRQQVQSCVNTRIYSQPHNSASFETSSLASSYAHFFPLSTAVMFLPTAGKYVKPKKEDGLAAGEVQGTQLQTTQK